MRYKRLAVWLTLYDQQVYMKDKVVVDLQSAGPTVKNSELTDTITECKTVEINELRAHTSLQD
jgi:hypothetical protein